MTQTNTQLDASLYICLPTHYEIWQISENNETIRNMHHSVPYYILLTWPDMYIIVIPPVHFSKYHFILWQWKKKLTRKKNGYNFSFQFIYRILMHFTEIDNHHHHFPCLVVDQFIMSLMISNQTRWNTMLSLIVYINWSSTEHLKMKVTSTQLSCHLCLLGTKPRTNHQANKEQFFSTSLIPAGRNRCQNRYINILLF